MNDLREAIRQVYSDHADRCHDPEVCIDEPIDTDEWRGCSGHTANAVLDVVTAHLTVTDADAEWYVKFFTENHLEWPYWARVKAALEAFVARKLKHVN